MGKAKYRVKFTLSDLKELPSDMQSEGEKIRVVYAGFEGLGPEILSELGLGLEESYVKFTKRVLNEWIDITNDLTTKVDSGAIADIKERWRVTAVTLVYRAIYQGHERIDMAHTALMKGNLSEFAGCLSEAGVYFGKLSMIYDLLQRNVFGRIGSIQSALSGAALGGTRSGATRRKQSRVPTPEALRIARQKLVDAGKPHREISAMLAKKYDCTTDHIRKILKRD